MKNWFLPVDFPLLDFVLYTSCLLFVYSFLFPFTKWKIMKVSHHNGTYSLITHAITSNNIIQVRFSNREKKMKCHVLYTSIQYSLGSKGNMRFVMPENFSCFLSYIFIAYLDFMYMYIPFTSNTHFITGWLHMVNCQSSTPLNCMLKHAIAVLTSYHITRVVQFKIFLFFFIAWQKHKKN